MTLPFDPQLLPDLENDPAPLAGWRDLTDALDAGIDRLILYGPPGTGKTFAALKFRARATSERLICTEDLTTADVTGMWMPTGTGTWRWYEGPAVRAWRAGSRLVVDEVDRAAGDVLSLLLAMTDTDGSAEWHHPETGEVIAPQVGFNVIMTTNLEDLNEIPVALRDRFPVAIHIDRPHPSAVASLSSDLRSAAMAGSLGDSDRQVSLRAFYAFDQLRHRLGAPRAAELVFGAHRAPDFLDAFQIGQLGS